jgi:hypothetical protein
LKNIEREHRKRGIFEGKNLTSSKTWCIAREKMLFSDGRRGGGRIWFPDRSMNLAPSQEVEQPVWLSLRASHPPVDWTLFFVDAPVGLWDGLMPASIRPIRIAVFNILAIQLALQWPTYSYSLFQSFILFTGNNFSTAICSSLIIVLVAPSAILISTTLRVLI